MHVKLVPVVNSVRATALKAVSFHHQQQARAVACHNYAIRLISIIMATVKDLELVSTDRSSIVTMQKLKRPKDGTDTTSEKRQKLATNSTTTSTASVTAGVYVRETSQSRGRGASRPEIQQHVGAMLGIFKDSEDADTSDSTKENKRKPATIATPNSTAAGVVYVREVSPSRGSGASKPEIQQRVGAMLGLFNIVNVRAKNILNEEQATLIATSLQHNGMTKSGLPITTKQLLQLVGNANPECQCKVHSNLPSLEPVFATHLRKIMSFVAELGGEMKGGNLTNCGVELLEVIFSLSGKQDIMVCPESTSSAAHAGSKVVYEIGIGEESEIVEATPDFYARNFEYVYLLIGECQSSGSKYPSVQLAIATLGQFASKRFKHPAKRLAACLFTKAKTASVFLGEERGRRDEKIFVSFSKVNRECAFNLTSEGDITDFANTIVGVIDQV